MPVSPVDWGLAERVAIRVSGHEPLAASYHYDRLAADFAEVTSQAEELVAAATGLRSASGPARARVVDRAAVPCVLDLGHLYSFQLCRGLPPLAGLDGFPLEAVRELHVAGADLEDRGGVTVYQDAHGGAEIKRFPVMPGADTDAVLGEAGYSAEEIAAFKASGVATTGIRAGRKS